jgi:hypothetical protein
MQITTNGISGGCLTTPQTVSWGNDNAIYCSKYLHAPLNSSITRLSFKYDTTQINPVNYDRAASLFLRPSADFNHYVIASITYDKKLQIVSYSWANSMPPVNLVHDHWYDFILTTDIVSTSQVSVNAQVNDLGLTGQFPPIPAGSSSGTFTDTIFTVDPAVEVSFTATQWGGAKYVDNFRFQGVKSLDSCTATSAWIPETEPFQVTVINGNVTVTNVRSNQRVSLYSSAGLVVYSTVATGSEISFNSRSLAPGIYFLHIEDDGSVYTRKLVLKGW